MVIFLFCVFESVCLYQEEPDWIQVTSIGGIIWSSSSYITIELLEYWISKWLHFHGKRLLAQIIAFPWKIGCTEQQQRHLSFHIRDLNMLRPANLNCISQQNFLTFLSQLHFLTVFLNCVYQIYLSSVFPQMYFLAAFLRDLNVLRPAKPNCAQASMI